MDIRSYFKGDSVPTPPKTPPKSPPRQTILELPEFLFISAASGVKRDRSDVLENIEDSDPPDGFQYGVHRVLSPLEVRVVPTDPKPIHPAPTNNKRKKKAKNNDDVFFFSDDLDEQARMFAAYKEKQKKSETAQTKTKANKKKKQPKSPDDECEIIQHEPQKPPPPPPSAPPSKSQGTTQTITNTVTKTITKTTTNTKATVTNSTHIPNNTPNTNAGPNATTLTTPNNTNKSTNNMYTTPNNIHAPPNTHPPPKPLSNIAPTRMDDKELEIKIQEQMEAVQKWQAKCSELRQQLAEATTQLTQSLDELDHLNSLYETSNGS